LVLVKSYMHKDQSFNKKTTKKLIFSSPDVHILIGEFNDENKPRVLGVPQQRTDSTNVHTWRIR
jgi:hypothetical protein